MGVGLAIHLHRDQWESGGSAWRSRDALLGEEPMPQAQSSSCPSCLKDVVLQVCPHLSFETSGLCSGARPWHSMEPASLLLGGPGISSTS